MVKIKDDCGSPVKKAKVAIVIPFYGNDPWRTRLYEWTVERWRVLLPGAEVHVPISAHSDNLALTRSRARNVAFAQAMLTAPDVIVLADADIAVDQRSLGMAVHRVANEDVWGHAYTTYYNMDEASTHDLLTKEPWETLPDDFTYDHKIASSPAGTIVLRPEHFMKAGGYDERFQGWGYEDNAFRHCLHVTNGAGFRMPGSCLHLWHPVGQTFDSPTIEYNRRLFLKYEMCASVEEVRRVRGVQ